MSYTLPTIEKSWTYRYNQQILPQVASGSLTAIQVLKSKIVYEFKESLKLGNWVVQKSSNGSSVQNYDLWTSSSALVPSSNLSWIVLRNNSIDTVNQKFDICVTVSNYADLNVYLCPYGYDLSTGSTSSRPSSLVTNDEAYVGSSFLTPDLNDKVYFHCMQSTDGHCTRFFMSSLNSNADTGRNFTYFIVDRIKSNADISTFPIPFAFLISGASPTLAVGAVTNTGITANSLYSNFGYAWTKGPNAPLSTTLFAFTDGDSYKKYDVFKSSYTIKKIKLFSEMVGWNGEIGEFYDLWKGQSFIPTGTTFPSDDTSKFASFGPSGLVVPWTSSSILI